MRTPTQSGRRKKTPEEDVEIGVDDARRFWGGLHPFYRPLLARDLEIKPFPWREWFFAAAPESFLDELRKLVQLAKDQDALEPACDEDGQLPPQEKRVHPEPAPEPARGQARLPW